MFGSLTSLTENSYSYNLQYLNITLPEKTWVDEDVLTLLNLGKAFKHNIEIDVEEKKEVLFCGNVGGGEGEEIRIEKGEGRVVWERV